MDLIKFRKILDRYANETANETERALVEAWYKSYSTNEIPIVEAHANQLRNTILTNLDKSLFKRKIRYVYFSGIAASLIILATATLVFFKNSFKKAEYATYTTTTNGMKEIKLADGSVVWLNANSKLKTPQIFNDDFRKVSLEEGEAFFSIKKDPAHPFIVNLGTLQVKVLGTSFDIKAYRKNNTVAIAVATGRVEVSNGHNTLQTLKPDQKLTYDLADKHFEVSHVDSEKSRSWRDGATYLKNADFNELALVVKNIYGIDIKPGNERAAEYRFSFKLIHQLHEQEILALIENVHNGYFRKEGNDLILY